MIATEIFDPKLRLRKHEAFDVLTTSTAKELKNAVLNGKEYRVYGNVNLSAYSAQRCNAKCPFCVEELRPLSRGVELASQKTVETDDEKYFAKMERVFREVRPLDPSLSITGGEISIDPRFERIVDLAARRGLRKRTMTTNGSGLLQNDRVGKLIQAKFHHLNISRAHWDEGANQKIMQTAGGASNGDLAEIIRRANSGGVRARLSCVLLNGFVDSLERVEEYLEWAASLGADNVVFRQLMKYDPSTVLANFVVKYSDRARVELDSIWKKIRADDGESVHPRFRIENQVSGYYYYVEVYKYTPRRGAEIDVVFEEADLGYIERRKPDDLVYELIFHPNGALSSTWQPWDGVIM